MQSITLNVEDEERLYNSFDPQRDLLCDEVKTYLMSKVQIEGRKDGVSLEVRSAAPIDQERFAAAIHRWVEDEEASIKAAHRKNTVQQLWMFGVGVLFIALSLMLQPMLNVVWFTVLSTIGAFSMWEAAGIWIVENPKLRMRKHAAARFKNQLSLSFSAGE